MIAYNWDKIGAPPDGVIPSWWFLPDGVFPTHWPLPLRIWEGISSYGGFIGGAGGFAFYVWWKRLPVRLYADTTIVGLLPAFSIGRIGCTVVSDHVGSAVDTAKWYAFMAEDYPRKLNIAHLAEHYPGTSEMIRAWNLGLIELLYLIPVNILILWLAFRSTKRMNAGFITVVTGVLYAPVRFYLDFLRPEETDPRYGGLTFAQWASILAFGASVYVAMKIFKTGKPAAVVATTSGEAQRQLKLVLREVDEDMAKQATEDAAKKSSAKDDEKSDDAKPSNDAAKPRSSSDADDAAADDEGDDDDDDDVDETAKDETGSAAKPGAPKRTRGKRGGKGGRKK
jgi:phosphatidylglycerol:prolipoprotein diacylglycerol transferase